MVGAQSMVVEIICKMYRIYRSCTGLVTSSKRVVLNSGCSLGSSVDIYKHTYAQIRPSGFGFIWSGVVTEHQCFKKPLSKF